MSGAPASPKDDARPRPVPRTRRSRARQLPSLRLVGWVVLFVVQWLAQHVDWTRWWRGLPLPW